MFSVRALVREPTILHMLKQPFTAGLGLTGTVAGHHVAVGNSLLMAQECGDTVSLEPKQAHCAQKGWQHM